MPTKPAHRIVPWPVRLVVLGIAFTLSLSVFVFWSTGARLAHMVLQAQGLAASREQAKAQAQQAPTAPADPGVVMVQLPPTKPGTDSRPATGH